MLTKLYCFLLVTGVTLVSSKFKSDLPMSHHTYETDVEILMQLYCI